MLLEIKGFLGRDANELRKPSHNSYPFVEVAANHDNPLKTVVC